MVDYLRARNEDGANALGRPAHPGAGGGRALVERGREIFGCEPVFVAEIGPVIGTHVGPGLLGVGGLPPSLLQ